MPPWSRRLPSRSSQNPLSFHLWDPALLALAQGRHRAGSEDTAEWTGGGRVTFWGSLWPLSDAMQAHHHPKLAIPSSWSHIIPKLAQWSPWPGEGWGCCSSVNGRPCLWRVHVEHIHSLWLLTSDDHQCLRDTLKEIHVCTCSYTYVYTQTTSTRTLKPTCTLIPYTYCEHPCNTQAHMPSPNTCDLVYT